MADQGLKQRIEEDMKAAMRAKDKERLGTIRLILSAIKQREVDERKTLDEAEILAVLDKMVKQRRESIAQYEQAGRDDLAAKEAAELDVLNGYLPAPLSDDELDQLIAQAVTESGAESVRDMGKVMGILRPKVQGRADMKAVSERIKGQLAG
ncbi:GatB/YqeY domain-containing protein [Ectothiorhodospiraceae bacterium 2226]|nr:GatB/YqeY domain-containing protein [Ectothiorhodospiraceae bacterium 2226]